MADNNRYPFEHKEIKKAPAKPGVYALYNGKEIIYIDRAKGAGETVRSRLLDHFQGNDGTCTQKSTHFWYEVTSSPASVEDELFKWHRKTYKRMPRCNEMSASD